MGRRSADIAWSRLCGVAAILITAIMPAAAQNEFPFEREMLLDVDPLPDSNRVPILEIFQDGRATIDLWCKSGPGRVVVTGEAISFTLGEMREERCTPERLARDEEMAVALGQVTQWRIEDDILVLVGPTEFRYRLSSH